MRNYTAIYETIGGFRVAIPFVAEDIADAIDVLDDLGYDFDDIKSISEVNEDDDDFDFNVKEL